MKKLLRVFSTAVLVSVSLFATGLQSAGATAPCPSGWATGGPIAPPEPGTDECSDGNFAVLPRVVPSGAAAVLVRIASLSYVAPAWCIGEAKPQFTVRTFDVDDTEVWSTQVSGITGIVSVYAPATAPGVETYRVRLGNTTCHAESVIAVQIIQRGRGE